MICSRGDATKLLLAPLRGLSEDEASKGEIMSQPRSHTLCVFQFPVRGLIVPLDVFQRTGRQDSICNFIRACWTQ